MNPTRSTRIDYETKIAFIHIEIKHKLPNKLTIQAMEELNSGQGHKTNSIDALFKEANIDLNYA